jgi:hypothetical protein
MQFPLQKSLFFEGEFCSTRREAMQVHFASKLPFDVNYEKSSSTPTTQQFHPELSMHQQPLEEGCVL